MDATPAFAAGNLLQNPSLEAASSQSVPTCWTLAGSGSNSYTWTRTRDAHSGSYAENLTLTRVTTGDRELTSQEDIGTCAPPARPGATYTVGAWYKSPAGSAGTPRFFAYYRVSGGWKSWSTSPILASSSAWTYATWTTPMVPAGATNLAVGMGLQSVGSVTMDDFSLAPTPDTTPPSSPTGLSATAGNARVTLTWTASTDNVGVVGYYVFSNGSQVAQTTSTWYAATGLTNGTAYSYSVAAYDAAGNVSAASSTVSATPQTGFTQQPSGGGTILAGYPLADGTCASEVSSAAENRPDNATANSTVPPNNGANVMWGTSDDSFSLWPSERHYVSGQYTGTTDEILQWSACKWGLDEDLVRSDAVSESNWHQNDVGDVCGPVGEASYGILQLKNQDCSGTAIDGGYPYTQQDTALVADYWGAHIRACIDGAFQGWLYDGMTVSQDIAAHETYADPVPLTGDRGQDYVAWGCIGQWYSGGWWDSDAQPYISGVQNHYVQKPWLLPGF